MDKTDAATTAVQPQKADARSSDLASDVKEKCSTLGKNCYSVLTWIGKIVWVLVPLLLTAVLVTILVNSLSERSPWTDALSAKEKLVHIDFMVLNMRDQSELEDFLRPIQTNGRSTTHLQNAHLTPGSYVLLASSCPSFEAGVYIVVPENLKAVEKTKDACMQTHLVHIQDIDSECRYIIKKGTYKDQVYQPGISALAVTASETCSSNAAQGDERLFLRSSELSALSGAANTIPIVPARTGRLVLELDQTMQETIVFKEIPQFGFSLVLTGECSAQIQLGDKLIRYSPQEQGQVQVHEVFEGRLR